MITLAAGGLNLLQVNPGLVFWTVVTFLVVVFILKAFAWNPIIHALDARSDKIHGDIEKAEALRKEAEAMLSSYNEKVAAAKDEAIAIVNESKSDATNIKNKMIQDATTEIQARKDQSLRDIELSKMKALQEIQNNIVDLSVSIASKILEKQLKPEDHANFVRAEITNLKKTKV
ncbi:MAG: F0F1 ATP synthase subunit B [Leptospiraceae bacterium]|nr:F0F1 ATP synthase subunit B [Leptospiraceae bacterium]